MTPHSLAGEGARGDAPVIGADDPDDAIVGLPVADVARELFSPPRRILSAENAVRKLTGDQALALEQIFFCYGLRPTAPEVNLALGVVAASRPHAWKTVKCELQAAREPWGTKLGVPPLPCADTRRGGGLVVPTVRR